MSAKGRSGKITAMSRKVNKPRITLRSKTGPPTLNDAHRAAYNVIFGVADLLEDTEGDLTKLDAWAMRSWFFATLREDGFKMISKERLKELRKFIKVNKFEDWTR